MSSASKGNNVPPSYMDGISVKISEKYKPPRRINASMSYSQMVTLNKLILEPPANYDFGLEESVKSRMREWQKSRSVALEERKQRLNNLNRDANEVSETKEIPNATSPDNTLVLNETTTASSQYYPTNSGWMTVASQQSSILTPTLFNSKPANGPCDLSYSYSKGSFNLSEFESDTSSPFDNEELKTINDLEELAQVLNNDCENSVNKQYRMNDQQNTNVDLSVTNSVYSIKMPYNQSLQSYPKEKPVNGYYYPNHVQPAVYMSKPIYTQTDSVDVLSSQAMQSKEATVRTVPEIMKSLEAEIASNHQAEKKESSVGLEDPFKNLSIDMQQMAVKISSMGFPLSRVTRACRDFDGNQKKIVEHLLALSDLLDLGFPEQNVVNALLKSDNDRDRALDLLIT